MKKIFRFEIIYQKGNPLSYENRKTLYINYQISFSETINEAEQYAIKCFELERYGDKLVSIRCVNE
jgi:hypothetical protein